MIKGIQLRSFYGTRNYVTFDNTELGIQWSSLVGL